eukprot:1848899-Prymnesium_polylepis.1
MWWGVPERARARRSGLCVRSRATHQSSVLTGAWARPRPATADQRLFADRVDPRQLGADDALPVLGGVPADVRRARDRGGRRGARRRAAGAQHDPRDARAPPRGDHRNDHARQEPAVGRHVERGQRARLGGAGRRRLLQAPRDAHAHARPVAARDVCDVQEPGEGRGRAVL